MKDLAAPTGGRGSDLLLRHCDSLTDVERPSAFDRLSEELGPDLAQMLVSALAVRRAALAAA